MAMPTATFRTESMEATQLTLLDTQEWKLDGRTREAGRQGIAQAREALRRAISGDASSPHDRSEQAA
jgi:hypothetical protein